MDEKIAFLQNSVPVEPAEGSALTPEEAMQFALDVGWGGAGFVSPNPLVGCVIVDHEHRFLSGGFHAYYGGPHAEAQALQKLGEKYSAEQLKEKLKGATVYVTLEPCAHEGKTPSCAKALAKFSLKKVFYGVMDPNPLVAGQGAQILQAVGIETSLWPSPWTEKLESLCEHFLQNFRHQTPFVSLKVASSLDGILALKSGESRWITSEPSRGLTHFLRGYHEALLVGVNTIKMDDPSLDVRHPRFDGSLNPWHKALDYRKAQKLVIIDPEAWTLKQPNLQIMKKHLPENIFIVVNAEAKKRVPNSVLQVLEGKPLEGSNSFDLKQILVDLKFLGISSVMVEGGAQTLSSFIMQMTAQRLYLFQAPVVLGSAYGVGWTNQVNILKMEDRIKLRAVQRLQLGVDQLLTGRFN